MAQKTNWDVLVERVNRNRVLVTVGVAVMLVLAVLLWSSTGGQSDAPDFRLTDTDGDQFSLSDYEGEQVVILEFMYSTCEPCKKLVKDALKPYSQDKPDDVAILSLSVFGEDSLSSLREHANEYGWRHALGGEDIEFSYQVKATPKIFIIDKEGQLTYSHVGPISLEELELEVDKALTPGQGNLVKVKETSIFLFAIGAGVAVFFSPCSFPLLPGYMTYYLSTKKRTSGTLDERTAREALPAGLAAASGVTGVLLLIGILLVPFVSLLGGILPLLELLVGLIIFALGVSMLLDYSLEPMLQPLRQGVAALGSTIGEFTQGRPTALAEKGIQRATGSDFSFAQSRQDGMGGLFLYGVGYGSAASGCMAPIVLGLLLTSLERGIVTGLVVFLLFAVTTGLLMVAFTLLVASSEDTIVNKLRASTHQIQIVGGAVMVIVGLYLTWYYVSTSLL
jgi:cytochrome c-type biogenesis protein